MTAPAGLAWEHRAAQFIDSIVDTDIQYLDVQAAIESLIHAGLHDELTLTFEIDNKTIHWHWMPPLAPGLSALDVLTFVEQSQLIRVIMIRFSTKDRI